MQDQGDPLRIRLSRTPASKNPEALKAIVDKHPKVEMDQINCEFVPHVVAMVSEQKIVFKSSDPTPHNVNVTAFKNQPFNQNVPPNTELEKSLEPENRQITVACNIHPWMKGYLMVFRSPVLRRDRKRRLF